MPLSKLDGACLSQLAKGLTGARCQIRLWDGSTASCSDLPPIGTVTIKNRATLWRLLWNADLAFGEGYTRGTIEVTGDLTAMMTSVNLALSARRRAPRRTANRRRAATVVSAQRHIHHHYDLGNEFFRLWLDDAMVYTCAYYAAPSMGLEDAQQAKLEYVCRKLRLRPGERVIEAGSGWGALAVYMAKHYGASVRAYNISKEQIAYAREQAARHGVADRVDFTDGDFRSITGTCDAFVSVGMVEHVGASEYAALGEVIDRVLERSHGRGLLHFIGRNQRMKIAEWTRRHIFPGTYAPVLSELAEQVLEPWDLSVLDVENLRWHYAATLRDWRLRFEQASAQIAGMFDEEFVRMWRLYLVGAEASFRSGDSQLFQVTFARPLHTTGPGTRADFYAAPAAAPRRSPADTHHALV